MDDPTMVTVPMEPHAGIKALLEAVAEQSGVVVTGIRVEWFEANPMGGQAYSKTIRTEIECHRTTR